MPDIERATDERPDAWIVRQPPNYDGDVVFTSEEEARQFANDFVADGVCDEPPEVEPLWSGKAFQAENQRDQAIHERHRLASAVERALSWLETAEKHPERRDEAMRDVGVILMAAYAGQSHRWRRVDHIPPALGERVECWSRGWASVAQGVRLPDGWRVWFGSEVTTMKPTVWRELPPRPLDAEVT
jgi:hypothetical protein